MARFIKELFTSEAAGGILLIVVTMAAILLANSHYGEDYLHFTAFWAHPVNDGLMVVFFLLVGLELKYEMTVGELAGFKKSVLPVAAALGGVLLPAAIYVFFNSGDSFAMRGWAIPTATDIAFSLGVLSLFAGRVPTSLSLFLMAVAVVDDLAAVLIIALFYTAEVSLLALTGAGATVMILSLLARARKVPLLLFLIGGVVLWAFILKSGIHPTIAGVVLGFIIPASMGKKLAGYLHGWVAFGVMPIFAFVNAGIPLTGLSMTQLLHPLPLGIILGLCVGKQLGIFVASWLTVKSGFAAFPARTSLTQFYAVCMLAGIGFTMSLFIGTLAFSDEESRLLMRFGVIGGSLISAVGGYAMLAYASRRTLKKA